MYGFLLALLVLDGVFLAVVILLQAGKGGGLAAVGGGAAATEALGGRQATTLLTRATWGAGAAFMAISLVLAIQSSQSDAPTSVLEGVSGPSTGAPAPVLGGETPGDALLLPGAGDAQTAPPENEEDASAEPSPSGGDAGSASPPTDARD